MYDKNKARVVKNNYIRRSSHNYNHPNIIGQIYQPEEENSDNHNVSEYDEEEQQINSGRTGKYIKSNSPLEYEEEEEENESEENEEEYEEQNYKKLIYTPKYYRNKPIKVNESLPKRKMYINREENPLKSVAQKICNIVISADKNKKNNNNLNTKLIKSIGSQGTNINSEYTFKKNLNRNDDKIPAINDKEYETDEENEEDDDDEEEEEEENEEIIEQDEEYIDEVENAEKSNKKNYQNHENKEPEENKYIEKKEIHRNHQQILISPKYYVKEQKTEIKNDITNNKSNYQIPQIKQDTYTNKYAPQQYNNLKITKKEQNQPKIIQKNEKINTIIHHQQNENQKNITPIEQNNNYKTSSHIYYRSRIDRNNESFDSGSKIPSNIVSIKIIDSKNNNTLKNYSHKILNMEQKDKKEELKSPTHTAHNAKVMIRGSHSPPKNTLDRKYSEAKMNRKGTQKNENIEGSGNNKVYKTMTYTLEKSDIPNSKRNSINRIEPFPIQNENKLNGKKNHYQPIKTNYNRVESEKDNKNNKRKNHIITTVVLSKKPSLPKDKKYSEIIVNKMQTTKNKPIKVNESYPPYNMKKSLYQNNINQQTNNKDSKKNESNKAPRFTTVKIDMSKYKRNTVNTKDKEDKNKKKEFNNSFLYISKKDDTHEQKYNKTLQVKKRINSSNENRNNNSLSHTEKKIYYWNKIETNKIEKQNENKINKIISPRITSNEIRTNNNNNNDIPKNISTKNIYFSKKKEAENNSNKIKKYNTIEYKIPPKTNNNTNNNYTKNKYTYSNNSNINNNIKNDERGIKEKIEIKIEKNDEKNDKNDKNSIKINVNIDNVNNLESNDTQVKKEDEVVKIDEKKENIIDNVAQENKLDNPKEELNIISGNNLKDDIKEKEDNLMDKYNILYNYQLSDYTKDYLNSFSNGVRPALSDYTREYLNTLNQSQTESKAELSDITRAYLISNSEGFPDLIL